MTNEALNPNAQVPNEAEKNKMTEEQLKVVRDHMYQLIKSKYNDLVKTIMEQPLPDQAFMQSLLFLDSGMLWVKEAVYFAPLVNKTPEPQAPQEETKPSE